MKRLRVLGVVVLAAAVVALVFLGFSRLFEQTSEEVRLPPKGAALYNPLFGLERSLVRHGTVAHSQSRLDFDQMALQPGDGLVLYSDPRLVGKDQAEALLDWVRRGGHLVVGMPNSDDSEPGALLDALAVETVEGGWRCERIEQGRRKAIEHVLCGGQRFTWREHEAHLWWGEDEHGYVFARLPLGKGSVDVLSTLAFLGNRQIERREHWQLAYQLLAPALEGRVHLVYNADVPSFWRVSWRHAWAILIGAVLALVAWLAMRSQRFGPLLPAEAPDRRALLEHVQAAGEHAWRQGAARELHAALRDAFLARLRRRDPLAAAMQGDERIHYLATKLAVDPARVRNALVPPPVFHAESFREAMASLIQLGLRL